MRWARPVPVADVHAFVDRLPGDPVEPSGQEIIDEHVILRRDDEHMDVLVPIRLNGSDQIWGLVFWLDAGSMQPGGEPLMALRPRRAATHDLRRTARAARSPLALPLARGAAVATPRFQTRGRSSRLLPARRAHGELNPSAPLGLAECPAAGAPGSDCDHYGHAARRDAGRALFGDEDDDAIVDIAPRVGSELCG